MRKFTVALGGATLAALIAIAAPTAANAQTSTTNVPGGDSLQTSLSTQGNWAGVGTSCITVVSNVTLFGSNPYSVPNVNNVTTLDAYGYYPTISWRGASRSGGAASVSLTDSEHNTYTWYADMSGAACINVTTPYIDGVAQGAAYVPSQGGWYYSNAGMN